MSGQSGGGEGTKKTAYQMLWNCGSCGTEKLLGVTHRHCPNCGSAQDPKARYFPEEGQEIAVTDHKYHGADWKCDACATANSAAANNCGACGCPRDGAKEVTRIQDPVAAKANAEAQAAAQQQNQRRQAPQKRSSRGKGKSSHTGKIMLGGAAVVGVILFVLFGIKFDREAVVTGHKWTRSIDVEEYVRRTDESECSSVRSGAKVLSQYDDHRTREVADGETCKEVCSTVRVDQGDGTFTKEKECRDSCTTKYRKESYTVRMCKYEYGEWAHERTETEASDNTSQEPAWPKVQLSGVQSGYGAQRTGSKVEEFIVLMKREDKNFECKYGSREEFAQFKAGSTLTVKTSLAGVETCPEAYAH